MKQIYETADEIIDGIEDGATILVGGFGLCGIPENVIQALVKKGTTNLTIVSNNCGVDDWGLGLLLKKKQIKKIYASYVGENKEFERQVINGELEVELVPQGTLAERLRAGGAGIPAFYTPAGVGTPVAEGKEIRTFEGKEYLLERAIKGDVSIVRAHTGDTYGNLVYRKTAQNFNPMIAAAGKLTIAEVENLQEAGSIDPHHIHTPGIYVNRMLEAAQENRIERKTVREA
ncbi:CoA transferase subunit A [Alkalicoccus daliensis]|uniref:3-oxoacid CoA-transferase subunit A n=1 Tax=Alkalicoccus daliensis TaxID=745820 RepID=A0A1H0IES1_9BACI|nr:CoA transferase subunit A [Alkalicoccus daliensis]SDO29571.1 3-oxoacid CoA-transferase subunit A [Alkalicoccus daliensis]